MRERLWEVVWGLDGEGKPEPQKFTRVPDGKWYRDHDRRICLRDGTAIPWVLDVTDQLGSKFLIGPKE